MEWQSEDIGKLATALTPTIFGLLGALALAVPFRFFEGFAPTPLIPLFVVFFWSLYHPDYLPAPSVFLIGLAQDFLVGGPIGLWALVYLGVHGAVLTQREFFLGRTLGVVWTGFAFAATFAAVFAWIATSIYNGKTAVVSVLTTQMAVTILTYPLFARGFAHLHRRAFLDE
ncbi:MAG: rod shape-determining protein MreD [Pseudomonadota bacterium]